MLKDSVEDKTDFCLTWLSSKQLRSINDQTWIDDS